MRVSNSVSPAFGQYNPLMLKTSQAFRSVFQNAPALTTQAEFDQLADTFASASQAKNAAIKTSTRVTGGAMQSAGGITLVGSALEERMAQPDVQLALQAVDKTRAETGIKLATLEWQLGNALLNGYYANHLIPNGPSGEQPPSVTAMINKLQKIPVMLGTGTLASITALVLSNPLGKDWEAPNLTMPLGFPDTGEGRLPSIT